MSTIFQPTRLVGAIAIAMGFSSTTFAQDQSTNKTATLDTIVVTASRSEEKLKNVPARLTVIDQKTIEQNPLLNISDVIQRDPSVYIKQSGGLGQISEISLRGAKSVHTLVLKDGARLNSQNELAPLYPAFLDTTDVQQVEILKGPASVQYGSDAIGGVVQLISKKPEKTGADLTGIYGENNTYKTIANANLVTDQGFYAKIGGQRLESDGTRILESQPKNEKASYDQKGYHAKVGFYQENTIDASASISENKGTNIFTNNYITNTAQRQFENRVINAKLAYNILPDLIVNARYSNVQDKQNVPSYGSRYDTENNEGDLSLKWKFTPNQNILVGATYTDANYQTNTILKGDQSVDSTGYYLQHQFKNEQFDTQVGVRLEDNNRFGDHTVGQAAVRYHFLPNASVYANIGSAFRAPTTNDLYAMSWGANPDLKPEESLSYEIGLDQKLAYNISTGLSLYTTEVDNLIAFDGVLNQMSNVEKAKMEGSELYVKWQGENLFTDLSYNYVRAKDKKKDENLSRRPRQKIALTAGWADEQYTFSTTMLANGDYDNSAYDNIQIPGHFRVDMHGQYKVNKNVDVFANIQNVGDSKYRTAYGSGSYYINGGRLASAGVTFRY